MSTGKVKGFVEKPKTDEQLEPVRMTDKWLARAASSAAIGLSWPAWAFTFSIARPCSICLTASRWPPTSARKCFRAASLTHHVQAHVFDGYWEDLGTVKAYHEASLALAGDNPPFNFHSPEGVIYTRMRFLPASHRGVGEAVPYQRWLRHRGPARASSVVSLAYRAIFAGDVVLRNSARHRRR